MACKTGLGVKSCKTISRKISCLEALRDKIVLILAKLHRDLARPTSIFLGTYLPNQYRRNTWLVHFGIIFLAGTPFFLEMGVMAPFLMGPAPILRKKGFPAKP
jgi:hypothetical protein